MAASLDGVWEWDAVSDVVQYSDRFAELLGFHVGELPATLDFVRGAVHPDDADALWGAIDGHLKEEKGACDVECRLRARMASTGGFGPAGRCNVTMPGGPFGWPGRFRTSTSAKWRKWSCGRLLRKSSDLPNDCAAENTYLQEEITNSQGFDEIVGQSELLRSTLSKIEHVAGTDASVLLLGETGTGKELLARAIHHRSPRKDRPLVKVNLAALPSSLIESELFGHVKGAFYGGVFRQGGAI